jgi:arginase
MMGAVEIIACPFNSSGTRDGVARMPEVLLAAGLAAIVPDARVVWADVPVGDPGRGASGLLAEGALTATVASVADRVSQAWAGEAPVVVVGGDCPVLLGALVAARWQGIDAGLVFVDGHEDAWDPHRSPTGEAADSEIALALGLVRGPSTLAPLLPCLSPAGLLQLGPRDAAELAQARQPSLAGQVSLLTGDRLAAPDGLQTGCQMAADLVLVRPRWWLHIDLDVLSTAALAAVDYQQPGGLSWDQLRQLITALIRLGGCAGISVCIYNPDLDQGAAADQIARYIADAAHTLTSGAG